MPMLYIRNKFPADSGSRSFPNFVSHCFVMCLMATLPLSVLSGCATAPASPPTPEAMKAKAIARSAERWKALTDKRFSDVYSYLSVGSRVGITAQEYAEAMRRMGYIRAEVESAECDQELCTVHSRVTLPIFIRNVGARPQPVPIEEKWTWAKGDLWLIRN